MIFSNADKRVREGGSLACVTCQPVNKDRSLFKRMTVSVPAGGLLVQDLGEMEGSDYWGNHYVRTSSDNGKQWTSPKVLWTPRKTETGGYLRMGESAFLQTGESLYRIYNLHEYPPGGFNPNIWWHNRIMIQRWDVQAGLFAEAMPIDIEADPSLLERFWKYGKNAIAICFCRPIVTTTQNIILPLQWIPDDPAYTESILRWRAGCLIGEEADGRIQWRVGGFCDLSVEQSTRGVFEPAIAEADNGDLIMIARGSNKDAPHLPAYKWTSRSTDDGRSWSKPEPLLWADRSPLYSPSSGSALIRVPSGPLLWLGNIGPRHTLANFPRHPLVMAKVSMDKGIYLRPESLCIVDCRREHEGDKLQLSNFKVFLDKPVRDIVLTYARLGATATGVRGGCSVEKRICWDDL